MPRKGPYSLGSQLAINDSSTSSPHLIWHATLARAFLGLPRLEALPVCFIGCCGFQYPSRFLAAVRLWILFPCVENLLPVSRSSRLYRDMPRGNQDILEVRRKLIWLKSVAFCSPQIKPRSHPVESAVDSNVRRAIRSSSGPPLPRQTPCARAPRRHHPRTAKRDCSNDPIAGLGSDSPPAST